MTNYNIKLDLEFRNCGPGEIKQGDVCERCPVGFFSPHFNENNDQPCIECDPNSMICLGGAKVGALPGFFRLTHTSTLFPACNPAQACTGSLSADYRFVENQCIWPYKGNVCYNCVSGHVKNGDSCSDCDTSREAYIVATLGIIFNLVLLMNSIKKASLEGETITLEEDESD